MINSDSLHVFRTDEYMSFYYLIIDNSFCKLNGLNFSKIHFEGKISDGWAISMFGAILRAYTEKGSFYSAKIRAKVLDFAVYLCEKYSNTVSERKRRHDKNFENIRKSKAEK